MRVHTGKNHITTLKGSRAGGGVEFQDDNDYGFVKLKINGNTLSG